MIKSNTKAYQQLKIIKRVEDYSYREKLKKLGSISG